MGTLSRSFAGAATLVLVSACATSQGPDQEQPQIDPALVDHSRALPLYEYQDVQKDYTCSEGLDDQVTNGERIAQVLTRTDAFYGKEPMRDLILMDGFDLENQGHPGLRIDFVGAFEDGALEAVATQWCKGAALKDISALVRNLNGISMQSDFYRNIATTTCEDRLSVIQHETTWAKSNISGEYIDQDGTRTELTNDTPDLTARAETFYKYCNQMISDFYSAHNTGVPGTARTEEQQNTNQTEPAETTTAKASVHSPEQITNNRLFKPLPRGIEGLFSP